MPKDGNIPPEETTDLIAYVAYSWKEIILFRELCKKLSREKLLEQSRHGSSHRRLEEVAYHVANTDGVFALRPLLNHVFSHSEKWTQRDMRHLAKVYCDIISQWLAKQ